jgi:hypothetical protein
MKSNKQNPITFFRKSFEDREKRIKSSMKKYAKGGPGDPPGTATTTTTGTTTTSPGGPPEKTEEQKAVEAKAAADARAKALGAMTNKQYRQEKKGIKRSKKLERIASGEQAERTNAIINAIGAGANAASTMMETVVKGKETFGKQRRGGTIVKKKMAMGGATKAKVGRVVKPPMGVSWINDAVKKGNNTPTDTGNPMADGFNRGIASVKDFGKGVSEGFKSSVKGVGNRINTVANSSTRDKDKTPNTPKHKKGGMTKAKRFAALAPPYNKATAADRIAGAKKNARKK